MTRETKIGLAMVLLMAGVFGFLVYKRINRPVEEGAETEQTASRTEDSSTKEFPPIDEDDRFSSPKQPEILPVAGQVRAISTDDREDDESAFAIPKKIAQAEPEPVRPQLPTMVPDEKDEAATSDGADDPFSEVSETAANDQSPAVMVESEPEATADDPFSGSDDSKETASLNTDSAGPILGFEAAEEDERTPAAQQFDAEPEVVTLPSNSSTSPALGDIEPIEEDDDTVSLRARAKIPEPTFPEEDLAETTPSIEEQVMTVEESSSTPELMLDDSDEDRYGGYRALEIVEVEQRGSTVVEVVQEPRQARGGRNDRFADRTDTHASRSHTVKLNETFWSISQKYYGTGRYFQALAAYNHRQIPDPTKMKPGVEIALPSEDDLEERYPNLLPKGPAEPGAADSQTNQPGELLTGRDGLPLYRIGARDTLSGIAQAHLGRASRWVQILEMNRDTLKDGNSLKIGMVLRLPHDARPSQVTQQPPFLR